jgi:putative nucleotidyltransferase with HDIG domain
MTAGTATARPAASALVTELLLQLEQLPPARAAALRVVQIVDDPDSGAADVAAAASVDAALTARMLRMANSAYYGLSGRVGTPGFAITVLGFATVRSLAAAAAAGLTEDANGVPTGFWNHAAATATAASLVAPRIGARKPEAFCLGLLHDLGSALLHRCDPDGYEEMVGNALAAGESVSLAERRVYGLSHEDAAARVLAAWRFPDELCRAVAAHHGDPTAAPSALAKALIAGEALALRLPDAPAAEARAVHHMALRVGRIDDDVVDSLLEQVQQGAAELAASLMSGLD